jgi:oxalate decarboxylase/phosphoglucose isomerase-like protein (cupin superfamily)
MEAVDPSSVRTELLDWGVMKWLVTPDTTDGADMTFGELVVLPGKGHERHNHPNAEEVIYVLSGEGDQMLDDGGEHWFHVGPGDTIYIPRGMFHSTVTTGWQPLRLLAIYNPGGSEKDLRAFADHRFAAGASGPEWRLEES